MRDKIKTMLSPYWQADLDRAQSPEEDMYIKNKYFRLIHDIERLMKKQSPMRSLGSILEEELEDE